jgi:hypothetical protein
LIIALGINFALLEIKRWRSKHRDREKMDEWEITLAMSRELMGEREKMSASAADERVLVGKCGGLLKENLVLRAWRAPLTSLCHGLGFVPLN